MNRLNKMANAIGNMDDRYLLEALEYCPRWKLYKDIRFFGVIAAGICLVIGWALWGQKSTNHTITVYAYESDKQLTNEKPVLMNGRIDDSGEMQGHPLQFYILGDEIESIRFSCKNEWISFVDWTEQRGDYGFSKNFTVLYGEQEDDYYYLVVYWTPKNIIRKLTDNEHIKISDLKQEEKEDVIVMEVKYLNGRIENAAIWIKLEDDGEFKASAEPYQVTEKDRFLYQQEEEKQSVDQPKEKSTVFHNAETTILSDEELAHIQLAIEEYYNSIHRKIVEYAQVDSASSYMQEYEGYEPDEVVLFEVLAENSENKRYITIGSKDSWNHCSILNEGY